jgi:hypothetical protein
MAPMPFVRSPDSGAVSNREKLGTSNSALKIEISTLPQDRFMNCYVNVQQ